MNNYHDVSSARSGAEPIKVLTVAGSDSGGAAGLQADLKTFTALGAYGMSVVTAVTAQNSQRVEAVLPLTAEMVESQMRAVLSDYGAAAVKTGFIGQVDLISIIAACLVEYRPGPIVVDPVLVNHKGLAMFSPAVTQAYVDHLLPLADLVTPNPEEATLLSGKPVASLDDVLEVADAILSLGPRHVLIKGYREGDEMVDVLVHTAGQKIFHQPVIDTQNTHGSGDTLSAAVCVFLAQGQPINTAVESAIDYTRKAILRGASWQLGGGHGPVSHF